MSEEVKHRIGDARKTAGAFMSLEKEAKVNIYDRIVEPTQLYGCGVGAEC